MDRIEDRLEIERLAAMFGHALDRGTVEDFAGLFTADALYTNGPRVLRGQAALRDFYIGRTAAGPRTSRHFTAGLIVDFDGPDQARGFGVCTTYAQVGEPEIACTMPAFVADFEDVYVREGGSWLFAVRHIRVIFRSRPSV